MNWILNGEGKGGIREDGRTVTEVFMSHPTMVLVQYLTQSKSKVNSEFELGRLAMALEVLTQMKIVRSLPMTDLSIQIESAFQAFLIDQGLLDEVERWYERLDAWRQPKFLAEHGGESAVSTVRGPASALVVPEGSLSRVRKAHASQRERRDRDEASTSESTEPPDEAA